MAMPMTSVSDFAMAQAGHDKGLQSRVLHEQVGAVVSTSMLIRENPFATFVNSLAFRLAEAFRDGSNPLRTCIVHEMEKCSEEMRLVFSKNEITKRIMKVSHNNDPEARALTLRFFAAFARVIHENQQVHHLVLESLDATNKEEFEAAVVAMVALAKENTGFSQSAVEKLAELLSSPTVSLSRKAHVVSVFGSMRADVDTTKTAFVLGAQLLSKACPLLIAKPLIACGLLIGLLSENFQLNLLLSLLPCCCEKLDLGAVVLHNLRRLAAHAHSWNEEDMKKLRSVSAQITKTELLDNWLHVFVRISEFGLATFATVFNELLLELSYLHTSSQLSTRVLFANLGVNVFTKFPSEEQAELLSSSLSASFQLSFPRSLAVKFYRETCCFLSSPSLSAQHHKQLLDVALTQPVSHPNFVQLLDCLCAMADRSSSLVPRLQQWAKQVVDGSSEQLEDDVQCRLAFLVFAPSMTIDVDAGAWKGDPWLFYRLARTAFRNGHWNNMAKPLLKRVPLKHLTPDCEMWLRVLRDLAECQPDEFKVKELQKRGATMQRAMNVLALAAKGSPWANCFNLPHKYMNALYRTNTAIEALLSDLRLFTQLGMPEQHVFVESLSHDLRLLRLASLTWMELSHLLFDADPKDHDTMCLHATLTQCLDFGVTSFLHDVQRQSRGAVVVPSLSVDSASNQQFVDLLHWANAQLQQLAAARAESTAQALTQFAGIMQTLCMRRVCVPRFFFQQRFFTTIRLKIKPRPQPEGVPASRGQDFPILVSGHFSSTNPTRLRSVTVTAVVQSTGSGYVSLFNHSIAVQEMVMHETAELEDNHHFSVQFVLSNVSSCIVNVFVKFTDADRGRQWTSDATAQLKVNTN